MRGGSTCRVRAPRGRQGRPCHPDERAPGPSRQRKHFGPLLKFHVGDRTRACTVRRQLYSGMESLLVTRGWRGYQGIGNQVEEGLN